MKSFKIYTYSMSIVQMLVQINLRFVNLGTVFAIEFVYNTKISSVS
jgi:hypothetical protein